MKTSALFLIIPAYFLVSAGTTSAQIVDCNGVLTNKPCISGKVLMEEKPYQPPTAAEAEQQRRQFLVDDLEYARLKAENDYQISVNVDAIKEICLSGSMDDCLKGIQDKENEINRLIASKIEKEKAEKKENENTSINQQPVQITIIQDHDGDYWHGRHRRVYDGHGEHMRPEGPGPREREVPKPSDKGDEFEPPRKTGGASIISK